ncbi:MAG TPA: SPOR domain-containing protein [Luteimonas sp.]|nr:SPOR domain-containing protein [Luteimonas sp.]
MDAGLKQRLIGAAVLVALAVIFLPMLVKGPAPDSGLSDLSMRVPDAPQEGYKTVDLPLVVPPEAPSGGVLAMREPAAGDRLPVVDTATASPDGDLPAQDEAAQDAADLARPEPAPASPQSEPDDAPAAASAPAATTTTTTTPAAPPAAERLPATAAGGDYVVHFGAFSSERDAQLIVRQLDGAGLVAYAEPFTLNGRPAQRVRLGPYASREAAEVVRVRAARVRDDVTPRVVALDAAEPAAPAAARSPAAAPAPKPAAMQAAPRPAPAVAAAGVGFAVQVGAFSSAADATRLRDRLRDLGMTAFTDTVDTDKGRLTRVKAGPVPTREDAERLKSQLKSRAGLDGIVRAHP